MHHHHGRVAVAALRHHVPHIHLVDGDVSAGTEVAQFPLRLIDLVAADEEAALGLQHQRLVRGLHVLESLRHHVAGSAEDAKDSAHERRRSPPLRESLTSHGVLLSR